MKRKVMNPQTARKAERLHQLRGAARDLDLAQRGAREDLKRDLRGGTKATTPDGKLTAEHQIIFRKEHTLPACVYRRVVVYRG